jgi:hypothetical protein
MRSAPSVRRYVCLFIAVLAFWTAGHSSALANDWNVVLNGRAVHINASENWNEQNWGLGFEREFATQSRWVPLVVGSGFRDSSNDMSYMAGGGIKRRFTMPELTGDLYVDLGLVGFMMTRRDFNNNQPFPGVLPVVSVGNSRMAVNVTYMPETAVKRINQRDASLSGVLFLQFSMNAAMLLPGGRTNW